MKTEILEIQEWYNEKGKLIEHLILYISKRKAGCFDQLPKTAHRWMKTATLIRKYKLGEWTCKIYRQ